MTDLERLWDDLPTGPAPTDAILRTARRAELQRAAAAAAAAAEVRRARRRRLAGRPLVAAAALTGLAAAFVVGANLGGGGGGGRGLGHGGPAEPAAFQADLKPAASCDDLLASYQQRGARLVTAWGWQPGGSIYLQKRLGALDSLNGTALQLTNDAPYARAAQNAAGGLPDVRTVRQKSSATGTNVQEAGVDEPDTVKTDGRILAQVHNDELWIYDVAGRRVRRLSSIPVDSVSDAQLLLSGTTLVVVGGDAEALHPASATRVLTIDVSDPRNPKQTNDVAYSAALSSARQHGSSIRLVLDGGLPKLAFVHPHKGLGYQAALAKNRALVGASTIGDWIPTIASDGGAPTQLIGCTDIAVPNPKVGLDTVGIVGFDASDPTAVHAIGLAGATTIAYESTDNLYLVASPSAYSFGGCLDCAIGSRLGGYAVPPLDMPIDPTTGATSYVFDFALNGDHAVHVASGEIEGRIDDRWAMDEVGGVLRVAVSPTSETGSFNSILTLRKLGQTLVPLGRIDHLGGNEQIQSVRWFDNLAILVTYRQLDPMYAVDLSHPAHPRLLSRLQLPGFSSYLHPLGWRRMVGVGTGPDGGTQIGLFDTKHLDHLRRIAAIHVPNTDPLAAQDPRAFTWEPRSRTVLTVLERWGASRVGLLATLAIRDGHLVRHLQRVEYGADVTQVRAVPLGDGRVVLVTGESARFVHLAPYR